MIRLDYIRSKGKKLTYRIEGDEWGGFRVWLDGELVLRGQDRLSAHGAHRRPSKRKEAGALQAARDAIETLRDMDEGEAER
jgi:hypothetical protein